MTTKQLKSKLAELTADVDAALAKIKGWSLRRRAITCVNWADLRCVDAALVCREDESSWMVTVSEANAARLGYEVAEMLRGKWGVVEVQCEW